MEQNDLDPFKIFIIIIKLEIYFEYHLAKGCTGCTMVYQM